MKAVILAGGLGTRLTEETSVRPKPMVEIGGKPILWHILKIYAAHGISDFIICCGYKGYVIKEYFYNYFLHVSDISLDIKNNSMTVINKRAEDWTITLVDTGDKTMTGGRLLRVKKYLSGEECFCLTYGDGVADIDITSLVNFHKAHGKNATLTATFPSGRFGALDLEENAVKSFKEKPRGDGSLINGGFFVLNSSVLDLICDDQTVWEQEPLNTLAKNQQLMAFKHTGFWHPMDTLRDKIFLDNLWQAGNAPWKVW